MTNQVAGIVENKIAELILHQIGSQVDLLFSLSVGVCGGIIAILLQIASNNNDQSKRHMIFVRKWMIAAAIISEMLAIAFGYFGRATLTAITPIIYKMNMSSVNNWTDAIYDGSFMMKFHVILQFSCFLLGIVLACVFVLYNLKKLKL